MKIGHRLSVVASLSLLVTIGCDSSPPAAATAPKAVERAPVAEPEAPSAVAVDLGLAPPSNVDAGEPDVADSEGSTDGGAARKDVDHRDYCEVDADCKHKQMKCPCKVWCEVETNTCRVERIKRKHEWEGQLIDTFEH